MDWTIVKEAEIEWFEYVNAVPDEWLYVEALRYLQRLNEHPGIVPHLEALLREDHLAKELWDTALREERTELLALFDVISANHPEWNEAVPALSGGVPNPNYLYSFQRIHDIRAGKHEYLGTPMFPKFYDDDSDELVIIATLQRRLKEFLQVHQSEDSVQPLNPENEWLYQVNRIDERHRFAWRKWRNQTRTSGALSLAYLYWLSEAINPAPRLPPTFQEFWEKFWSFQNPMGIEDIADTVYRDKPPNPERVQEVRQHLTRLHVALRSQFSNTLMAEQLVGRYKARAMWYDKERLISMVQDSNGNWIRNREVPLMNDLARFVFDQGLPAWQRVQLQNLEPDLMITYPAGVLIEGKATIESSRTQLIEGMAQLLSYLNAFELSPVKIIEAFFVVFRLDGPLYALPGHLAMGPWIVRPMVIDLGGSKSSGRRQRKVQTISEAEILARLEIMKAVGTKHEPDN